MKNKLITLIVSSILALSASIHAGEPADKPVRGKVSAVGEAEITISNKKGGDKTFKTDADTKFSKTDGSKIALSDVKVGSVVQIKAGATPDVAAKVTVVEQKKKDKGDDAAKTPKGTNGKAEAAPAPEQ